MTKIITLTTESFSYLIEISLDEPIYRKILLPIFDQLHIKDKYISLDKDNLILFKNKIQYLLENYICHYQPEEGRGREKKVFGKSYFFTLLSTEHNTIALLIDIYDAAEDCIQNNISLRFEYS